MPPNILFGKSQDGSLFIMLKSTRQSVIILFRGVRISALGAVWHGYSVFGF